jgi:hypothetical protein
MKGVTPVILYTCFWSLTSFIVIKDFYTVETADGTKVGRDWKVVKSEYVV